MKTLPIRFQSSTNTGVKCVVTTHNKARAQAVGKFCSAVNRGPLSLFGPCRTDQRTNWLGVFNDRWILCRDAVVTVRQAVN